jgi:hypothetical protein
MLHAEPIIFTEASTTLRAGRCRVVGWDVHEDHASAAVAAFGFADTSVSGDVLIHVELAADTSKHQDYHYPREFNHGLYLKGSPTGQFTGTVWVV